MYLYKIVAIFVAIQISAVNCSTASLERIKASILWQQNYKKPPAKYFVAQQNSSRCATHCWFNFHLLQRIRESAGGYIVEADGKFSRSAAALTRIDWFLTTTSEDTAWYHILNNEAHRAGSTFEGFVKRMEDTDRTISDADIPQEYLEKLSKLDRRAVKSFWPHCRFREPKPKGCVISYLLPHIPMIEENGKFYWGIERTEIPQKDVSIFPAQAEIPAKTIDKDQAVIYVNAQPHYRACIKVSNNLTKPSQFPNFIHCYLTEHFAHNLFFVCNPEELVVEKNQDYRDFWYNFGIFKLMLMAAGIDSDNNVITYSTSRMRDGLLAVDASAATDVSEREHQEILQFNSAINATPNPWQNIDQKRDSFIEYRIAELFKRDSALKAQAIAVVDVFFKTFGFYTDVKSMGLATKMQDFPGEDQMLSYYFCQNLRNLSAAAISADALQAVLELESSEANLLRAYLFFTERITSLPAYFRKKYYEEKVMDGDSKTSFNTVWQEIKRRLELPDGTDMVSFSGHGAVLSFDSRALRAQHFEDRVIANDLGFVTIDSSYANKTKPFYMVGGDDE